MRANTLAWQTGMWGVRVVLAWSTQPAGVGNALVDRAAVLQGVQAVPDGGGIGATAGDGVPQLAHLGPRRESGGAGQGEVDFCRRGMSSPGQRPVPFWCGAG